MKDADWIKDAMREDSTPMSAEEEKALFARYATGDKKDASDEIVLRSRRFILSLVLEHQNCPMEGQDLFNEGIVGLIEAMESFDTALGIRFVTYAKSFIVHRICEYIADNTNTISLPVYVRKQLAEINITVYRYIAENGKKPSVEAIAEAMGKDPKVIARYLNDYNISTVSLEQPSYDDEGSALIDKIPAPDEETGSDNTDLYEAIAELDDKEKLVTLLHYGFTDQGVVSFDEISKQLGKSNGSVRMIDAGVRHKLRLKLGPR